MPVFQGITDMRWGYHRVPALIAGLCRYGSRTDLIDFLRHSNSCTSFKQQSYGLSPMECPFESQNSPD